MSRVYNFYDRLARELESILQLTHQGFTSAQQGNREVTGELFRQARVKALRLVSMARHDPSAPGPRSHEGQLIKALATSHDLATLTHNAGTLLQRTYHIKQTLGHHPAEAAEAPSSRNSSPNVRINVAPTPITRLSYVDPEDVKFPEPPNMADIPNLPDPDVFLVPQRLLHDVGVRAVQRIRHHRPGQRYTIQDLLGSGIQAVVGGLGLRYGAQGLYQLLNYLNSEPEVVAEAEEKLNQGTDMGILKNIRFGAPTIQQRPPRYQKRYVGNYKFPRGPYNYETWEKFTRNNTLYSMR